MKTSLNLTTPKASTVSRDPTLFRKTILRQSLTFDSLNRGTHKLNLGPLSIYGLPPKRIHFGRSSYPVRLENGNFVADVPRIHLPMPGFQEARLSDSKRKNLPVLLDMMESGTPRKQLSAFVNRRGGSQNPQGAEFSGTIDKRFTHIVVEERVYPLHRTPQGTTFARIEELPSGTKEAMLMKPASKDKAALYESVDLQLYVI